MEENLVDAILGAIVTAVVAGIGGLFVRLRNLEGNHKETASRVKTLEKNDPKASIEDLKKEVQNLRLCMSDSYIRRDDWVPTMSKILGAMEKQGEMLARHDERIHLRGDEK